MSRKLQVADIFVSIQGEGANAGIPAIFIRLAGCNMNCAFCDTDFNGGAMYTVEELKNIILKSGTKTVIWTGGEPTLQLTDEILLHFNEFYNCIETNGTRPVPETIDYISCSPKVPVDELNRNFKKYRVVDEFRYPIAHGDPIPDIDTLPKAKNYFLSPIFDGEKKMTPNYKNINYCLQAINTDQRWRISIQMHKMLNLQ